MLYILVEHYLTNEGKKYFTDWMHATEQELAKFTGFIKIEQLIDVEFTTRSLLLLQFDTLENLRLWSGSKTHEKCLANLAPYMLKKQTAQILEN